MYNMWHSSVRDEIIDDIVDEVLSKNYLNHYCNNDHVSRGLYEQIKWERDVAIAQLKDLGICFGQKIDGVYLTKEEYETLLDRAEHSSKGE